MWKLEEARAINIDFVEIGFDEWSLNVVTDSWRSGVLVVLSFRYASDRTFRRSRFQGEIGFIFSILNFFCNI